jgi:DNA (cytosine-5)-methyltransferase 1
MTGYAVGEEWDKLKMGEHSRKYVNLWRTDMDKPCPTVTAAGGFASTASVTHPTERRKFSIAELKRICGFPDDYVLTGDFKHQWERLGRSVPPAMMFHIASAVRDQILKKL